MMVMEAAAVQACTGHACQFRHYSQDSGHFELKFEACEDANADPEVEQQEAEHSVAGVQHMEPEMRMALDASCLHTGSQ